MLELRALRDDELGRVRPMFQAVFGSDISLAMLHWKYGHGRGTAWTAWQHGELLLHCGVWPRQILLQGEHSVAVQLVDLMAAPKQAGLTRRASPFAHLMRHLLTRLPRPANPDGLAFGFPSGRAMRLGELAGVYTAVDDWLNLSFGARALTQGPRAVEIRCWGDAEASWVASLWRRMRGGLQDAAVGVRDMDYLRQRYLRHPDKTYRLLLVQSRWYRAPAGLLVLGPDSGGPELLDVICAPDDFAEVMLAARRWLHSAGLAQTHLMLTSTFARRWAHVADHCGESEFRIMGNPFSPAAALARVQGRWWLTGGDTDYR